jgi:hypothetical protein
MKFKSKRKLKSESRKSSERYLNVLKRDILVTEYKTKLLKTIIELGKTK